MSAIKTLSSIKKNQGGGSGLWKTKGTNEIEPIGPTYINVYCPNNLKVVGILEILSDERLKTNIEPIPKSDLDKLMQIQPKQYTFKADPDNTMRYGVIAQEIEQLFPHLVSRPPHPDAPMSVHYLEILPLMLLKIQDLQEQINELKK